MDPHTERIIERARQRRDILAQKLGETPEAVPRKRRTPLVEENTENVPPPLVDDDDSPKRHCARDKLEAMKPDTPAVSSVKSRMTALSKKRSEWSASSGDDPENDSYEPPARERYDPPQSDLPTDPPSRKHRLANLAQTINCWEDDLSHPTIVKEEPEKRKWRPPKPAESEKHEDNSTRQRDRIFSGQHKKGKAPTPPEPKTEAKPPKYLAPKAPPLPDKTTKAPSLPDKVNQSPAKLTITTSSRMVSPAKPAKPVRYEIRQNVDQTPINIQEVRDSGEETDEPTHKPVTDRMAHWQKKSTSSPAKSTDPIQQPISARFAKWEERVSQTPTKPIAPKANLLNTPKQTVTPKKFSSASKATIAPSPATKFSDAKQSNSERKPTAKPRESTDPASKPVSERMAKWQQKAAGDVQEPKEDEPTAYSVNARMSAWEHMSSSNQVSYVKKVEPGSSPARSAVKTPPCSPATKLPSSAGKALSKKSTPSKPGLKPQKSFAESILEKAGEIRSPYKSCGAVSNPEKPPRSFNSSSPGKSRASPNKGHGNSVSGASPEDSLSPPNSSHAMKTIHQRLLEQTNHSTQSQSMAERMREERMKELSSIQNRWQNGILQENTSDNDNQQENKDHSPPKMQRLSDVTNPKKEDRNPRREEIRANARSDFEEKLGCMGFDVSHEMHGVASVSFRKSRRNAQFTGSGSSQDETDDDRSKKPFNKKPTPPAPPPMKFAVATPKDEKRPANCGGSLLNLARKGSRPKSSAPVFQAKFDDGFDSDEESVISVASSRSKSQCSIDSDAGVSQEETEPTESQDSLDADSSFERFKGNLDDGPVDEGDDVSLSAFVPASVRRQSILLDRKSLASQSSPEDIQPHKNKANTSQTKHDDDRYVFHRSEFHVQELMHQKSQAESTASLNSNASSEVSIGETYESRRKYYEESEGTETDEDDCQEDMGDFLDEAIDEEAPKAAPRKRRSHMMATETAGSRLEADNPLMYSVSMYRSRKYARDARPPPKMVIKRTPVAQETEEEEFNMPTTTRFSTAQTQSIEEKMRELTELGNQELSVIKQTSNALNQCCMGNSSFAGSSEQAECNRLLLISSQRRMSYMSEIQRLKDQKCLEPHSSGPKGSLTISEMRLPLKREFVSKLGTTQDCSVHYFIILIRNGPHVIVTEMLSTHDERIRGSLDFPNHININDITGNFQVQLEIYGMSIVRELTLKDKKKNKTPKKGKKDFKPFQSPGGPNAVMTSSFKLIAILPITMKSVDKACFNLEKVPYVSPIYGTIYMRLSCTKEANVQERGFLTMFEDVSGLGAWHRRWCVLSANKICFWKYPDDETRKEPMGLVDLKRCITEKIGVLPRDVCARQHTFELTTIRQPRKGEQDTLVSKTYSTMTTLKHMLSADTKEERILWCNKINRALLNIRTWHPDAARPIRSQQQQK